MGFSISSRAFASVISSAWWSSSIKSRYGFSSMALCSSSGMFAYSCCSLLSRMVSALSRTFASSALMASSSKSCYDDIVGLRSAWLASSSTASEASGWSGIRSFWLASSIVTFFFNLEEFKVESSSSSLAFGGYSSVWDLGDLSDILKNRN